MRSRKAVCAGASHQVFGFVDQQQAGTQREDGGQLNVVLHTRVLPQAEPDLGVPLRDGHAGLGFVVKA